MKIVKWIHEKSGFFLPHSNTLAWDKYWINLKKEINPK